jgi:hypothetical protein
MVRCIESNLGRLGVMRKDTDVNSFSRSPSDTLRPAADTGLIDNIPIENDEADR